MKGIEPALISRAQAGDIAARNEIIDHFSKLLWHLANQCAKPSYPADDLHSEGVLELIRVLPLFDAEQGSLKSFITRCIRNRFLVLLRQDRRFRARWLDFDADNIPDSKGTIRYNSRRSGMSKSEMMPSAEFDDEPLPFDRDSAPALLRSLLQQLPESDRVLVQHYYGRGKPKILTEDLGALLGVKPAAVRMRVRKALQSLRHLLEENKIELANDAGVSAV